MKNGNKMEEKKGKENNEKTDLVCLFLFFNGRKVTSSLFQLDLYITETKVSVISNIFDNTIVQVIYFYFYI